MVEIQNLKETDRSLFQLEEKGEVVRILKCQDVSLEHLVIPMGITEIAPMAFSDCRKLKDVYIPKSVSFVGENAFLNCPLLREIRYDNAYYIGSHRKPLCVVNRTADPSAVSVSFYPHTEKIKTRAFENCKQLKGIVLPKSVTNIGSKAFLNCNSLEFVLIEGDDNTSALEMGSYVFSDCTSLTDVACYKPLLMYLNGVFDNCSHLQTAAFYSYTPCLPDYTFSSCHALEKLVVKKGLEYVGNHAVDYCPNLKIQNIDANDGKEILEIILMKNHGLVFPTIQQEKNFKVPDSGQFFIGEKLSQKAILTFLLEPLALKSDDPNIQTVSFSFPFPSLNEFAFSGNNALSEITFSDCCNFIEYGAFCHCRQLKKVILSEETNRIGEKAFYDCPKLVFNEFDGGMYLGSINNPYYALITAGKNTKKIHPCTQILADGACQHSNIEKIYIPRGIHFISFGAFAGSPHLKEVTINNHVSAIETFAFAHCKSLEKIVLPSSLVYIGDFVLEDCPNLKTIKYESTQEEFSLIVRGRHNATLSKTKYFEYSNEIIERRVDNANRRNHDNEIK